LTLAEGPGQVNSGWAWARHRSLLNLLYNSFTEFGLRQSARSHLYLYGLKMCHLAKTYCAMAVLLAALSPAAADADAVFTTPALDHGFQLLYNLDFDRAHGIFSQWEQNHPDDPMGPTCDAVRLLFSEFHRLGILEGQFLVDDKKFENRPKLTPDPSIRARFDATIERAQLAARTRLTKNPKDRDALFAMTLTNGLQADYAALIEKRNLASLHFTKESTMWGERTLAVDPDCYDAHIAGGISKYIIGSMAAPVRWLVRLGGVSGDKQAGVKELKLVADRGHYLAPFANILLAIAYVRDHDKQRARELLASLRDQFPANPLFAQEIARLDSIR
jgi:hypothetical protein